MFAWRKDERNARAILSSAPSLCGEPEPFDENGNPTIYAFNQRLFKEVGEPRPCVVDLLYALQLRAYPSNPQGHDRDGSWRYRPAGTGLIKPLKPGN